MAASTGSRHGRGNIPRNLDPLTRFFWMLDVEGADFHDEEESYKQFKAGCWLWKGGLSRGITPWFKADTAHGSYRTSRQWIMRQLHPEARQRRIKMICDAKFEDLCVNPFHMEQEPRSKPEGVIPHKPVPIVFPETKNRPRLLHHVWRSLHLMQEETHRQRSLPQYYS